MKEEMSGCKYCEMDKASSFIGRLFFFTIYDLVEFTCCLHIMKGFFLLQVKNCVVSTAEKGQKNFSLNPERISSQILSGLNIP